MEVEEEVQTDRLLTQPASPADVLERPDETDVVGFLGGAGLFDGLHEGGEFVSVVDVEVVDSVVELDELRRLRRDACGVCGKQGPNYLISFGRRSRS